MRRRLVPIFAVFGMALLLGCVTQPPPPPVATATQVATTSENGALTPAALAGSRVIDLTRVQIDIPRGTEIGHIRKPLLFKCDGISAGRATYDDSRVSARSVEWKDNFYRVMSGHGYQLPGAPGQLFAERGANEPDFLIGANITNLRVDADLVCDVMTPRVLGMRGTGTITVDWQVFDPVNRRVIHQSKVEGRYEASSTIPNDNALFMYLAFADAANKFALDPRLRDIVTQQRPTIMADRSLDANMRARLPLRRTTLSQQPIDTQIDRLRSATVLIETGDGGHGSGFLVTEDGLMITNKHVVGGQRFVRVRLVSGRSVVGEVLREHELRDVALVKLEGSGYPVMAIRETPVRVTEEVYAIGAPRERMLAWTVTRGVVSAWRPARPPREPFDLIQSDVPIHGGNSGGPMLDRQGNLVAIAVAGYNFGADKQANASLNLFIPILDGLEKLGMELVDPAEFQRRRNLAGG
jgi:serine protease Do